MRGPLVDLSGPGLGSPQSISPWEQTPKPPPPNLKILPGHMQKFMGRREETFTKFSEFPTEARNLDFSLKSYALEPQCGPLQCVLLPHRCPFPVRCGPYTYCV